MRFKIVTAFITLFFLGCFSFQTVAFHKHLSQHALKQTQKTRPSLEHQIDDHLNADECKSCTFYKNQTVKVFSTDSDSFTFTNPTDLFLLLFPSSSIVFSVYHSSRAPPFI